MTEAVHQPSSYEPDRSDRVRCAPCPHPSLHRARRIGEEAGLAFVYEANVPGAGGESTRCPGCAALLMERYGNTLLANRIGSGHRPDCGHPVAGVEMDGAGAH